MIKTKRALTVSNLKTYFYSRDGVAKVVDGIDFDIRKGQVLGLVGESGCGKSMTALSIMRLLPHPGKIVDGKIYLKDINILSLSKKEMRSVRGKKISMIFQEPMISLNPAFTIGNQILEAIRIHEKMSKREAKDKALTMLEKVELPNPQRIFKSYPHHLSGGMRQRVMIAEALLQKPDVLIADEPTTALDVTVQAQVLEVMYRLADESKTAIVLITHNLGLVSESADKIIVIYAGKIVEEGNTEDIFENAGHPYTKGLLRSVPLPGRNYINQKNGLFEMKGIVPNILNLPGGCLFHNRCNRKMQKCSNIIPGKYAIGNDHFVSCFLYDQ